MSKGISILSLYAEGDMQMRIISLSQTKFQSSPSMQRETIDDVELGAWKIISILSLYAEGDSVKT